MCIYTYIYIFIYIQVVLFVKKLTSLFNHGNYFSFTFEKIIFVLYNIWYWWFCELMSCEVASCVVCNKHIIRKYLRIVLFTIQHLMEAVIPVYICRTFASLHQHLFFVYVVVWSHEASDCMCTGVYMCVACVCIYMCVRIYTECPRKNVPDFGRVFLMLKYTDITQNTYIQSWTVTEIIAREVWNFDSCYSLIEYQIHIKTGRNMLFLKC